MAAQVRESTNQLARIDQMTSDAEKYLATRDVRYREKFAEAFREFGPFEVRALHPTVLDSLRFQVQAAGEASQERMRQRLVESETAAQRAARVAWVAVSIALVLGALLATALVRAIVRPLDRLAAGTRDVAAGRFNARLGDDGADEFAVVARDFNVMTKRLAELDRMKKDFVAKVSHDLKTPLSSMQETNHALIDEVAGPLSSTQRRLLELNLESGQRLSAMLGKLLDLSRIEAGVAPVRQPLDVAQIAQRSVDNASASASRRGVKLSMAAVERATIVGDAQALTQVIDNLVENAIKFSPANSEVRVSVEEGTSGGDVSLTIADEGPGIPEVERTRVFDRFYQTDAGRAVAGRGVGLGLTICREIVSAHGGRIWVDGNGPRGSVFHVALRRGAAVIVAAMLTMSTGCAGLHRSPGEPRPEDLQLRIASLTAEVDAVRARLDSTAAVSDSLRLELQRIKDIDLKLRPSSKRPPRK
jgi:signal transduction histidine kinase